MSIIYSCAKKEASEIHKWYWDIPFMAPFVSHNDVVFPTHFSRALREILTCRALHKSHLSKSTYPQQHTVLSYECLIRTKSEDAKNIGSCLLPGQTICSSNPILSTLTGSASLVSGKGLSHHLLTKFKLSFFAKWNVFITVEACYVCGRAPFLPAGIENHNFKTFGQQHISKVDICFVPHFCNKTTWSEHSSWNWQLPCL